MAHEPTDPAGKTGRTRRAVVLLLGNCAVLLAIVLVANLLSAAYLDLRRPLKWAFRVDERAALPNYSDREQAERVFEELHALETRYQPHVVWSRAPFGGTTTTIDESGDRVHETERDRPIQTLRLFGGSTMWGSGVPDSETIPALLAARAKDFQVLNHGETGFHSRQELARLINLVNTGAPMDTVIFYDGNNEGATFCRNEVPLNGSTRT